MISSKGWKLPADTEHGNGTTPTVPAPLVRCGARSTFTHCASSQRETAGGEKAPAAD